MIELASEKMPYLKQILKILNSFKEQIEIYFEL